MNTSFAATNKNQHKDKKIPKLHTLIHQFAKIGLNLSRRDNSVFYKLLGFLLRNDKSFPYTNEKLSLETLYEISSIKEALNNLEKLGLIAREGFSYRRRFSKGKTLVNICTHSQYCIYLLQEEINTHSQPVASTSQKMAGTSQKPATIELKKNLLKLKEESANAIQKQKPKTSKHPKPTAQDYKDYIQCKPGSEWVGEYRKDMGVQ